MLKKSYKNSACSLLIAAIFFLQPAFAQRAYIVGAGPGSSPNVVVRDSNNPDNVLASFFAYEPSFTGGVRVASADFNGDGVSELITGAGELGGPRVRIFDGRSLRTGSTNSFLDFFAYESNGRFGVSVAAGDVTGDGVPDLVTSAGIGGAPRINVYNGVSLLNNSTLPFLSFFAFDQNSRAGCSVAIGDVNGDGVGDIIAGAGPDSNIGPRVSVFSGVSIAQSNPQTITTFFAYEAEMLAGVNVASGKVNRDQFAEVIVGPGNGGAPRVRVLNGEALRRQVVSAVFDIFAFPSDFRGGLQVASYDTDADGFAEVITAPGQGGGPILRAYKGSSVAIGQEQQVANFFAFDSNLRGGAFVGAGDFTLRITPVPATSTPIPPTVTPFPTATRQPTAIPISTVIPTVKPSATPTRVATATLVPTQAPVVIPTLIPTSAPTALPGCQNVITRGIVSNLSAINVKLSLIASSAARTLMTTARRQGGSISVERDVVRSKRLAEQRNLEAQTLLLKVPSVIQSCSTAPEFCSSISNAETINGLKKNLLDAAGNTSRFLNRAGFRDQRNTRSYQSLIREARSLRTQGLQSLSQLPEFRVSCG